jgi:hypothetical protein
MKLTRSDKEDIVQGLEAAKEAGYHGMFDDLIERFKQSLAMSKGKKKAEANPDDIGCEPDWSRNCSICDQTPIVPDTGMCGPCTFGEAATAGGNW